MKTHMNLNHRHIGGEKRDMWWLLKPHLYNTSMKTHHLNHRQISGEKRDMWSTASYIKQFNENLPPNIKQRHNRRRENSYVVVTYSLI